MFLSILGLPIDERKHEWGGWRGDAHRIQMRVILGRGRKVWARPPSDQILVILKALALVLRVGI